MILLMNLESLQRYVVLFLNMIFVEPEEALLLFGIELEPQLNPQMQVMI